MNKYTLTIGVFCAIVFCAVVFIFLKVGLSAYHRHEQYLKDISPVTLHLDTRNMQPLKYSNLDSAGFVNLVDVFLCKQQNNGGNVTWADAYVCAVPQYTRPAKMDTVLVLDTDLHRQLPDDAWQAGINIKPDKQLPACKIMVPKNKVSSIKRYPCRYGRIVFVIDG